MKKHWKLVLLGFSAYLLFLLFLTPVNWWLRLVQLPPSVQIGHVTGTLWRGEIAYVSYQQLQLPALRWYVAPWPLLRLTAKLHVTSVAPVQSGMPYVNSIIEFSPSKITMTDTVLQVPVASVLPQLQLPLPVQATGDLLFDIQRLQLDKLDCGELHAVASWRDARLQPPTGTWLELQHIHARLSCVNGMPMLVTEPDNVLGLDITASLSLNGAMHVQGSLLPSPDLPAEVHQAMRFVGQPDADGRYRLNF